MNKTVELNKNCKILFILNICVLLSLVLFRNYFSSLNYSKVLINVMLIINIVILIVGIIFNVILLNKPDLYNGKKILIIIISLFILYLLINTVAVTIINKPLNRGYKKIADKLVSYCDSYNCGKYETKSYSNVRDFVISKTYLDYNGVKNDIKIHTKYDSNHIISVTADVYSQKEMFSQALIKEQLKDYFDNFNIQIDESMIEEAFENRFKKSIKKDNIYYSVSEIYEKGKLVKLKTTVTLKND